MTVSASDFRSVFPEFADTTKYSNTMVEYYASLADLTLNVDKWGDFLTHGSYLFIAHNCTLRAKAAADAAAGGIPGQGGVVASKSVADVSISYDTNASNMDSAGNYNATIYGRELLKIARIVGIVAFVGTPQTT
jgi:hypothetical protein